MLTLKFKTQTVEIDAGELVGFRLEDHEFIHQKGSPGWRNSDTEMFPIIGPTSEAGFRVHVPRGNAIQDQHGLLRELDYELISSDECTASFKKNYKAGTLVENSKFPEKSTAKFLIWPFNFSFVKHYTLSETGLMVRFEISGENDMPYMLGYHPAFKIHLRQPEITAGERSISLAQVLEVGSRALEVPDCNTIVLKDAKTLKITSKGFRHFMLWTEVPNMLCIEPISFYPYAVPQQSLHEGFDYLSEEKTTYELHLNPFK